MKKTIFVRICLFVALCMALSCHMTKRRYMKGYHVQHRQKTYTKARPETADLTRVQQPLDTFASTTSHTDTLATTVLAETKTDTIKYFEEEKTAIRKQETPRKKNLPHVSYANYRNYKHAHKKYISGISRSERIKARNGKVWWDLYGKKILITALIFLSIAASLIILFSAPVTLSTLSWAWFALSFIPAAFFPAATEVEGNKALLFLLGLGLANLPIPLAFLGKTIFTSGMSLFGASAIMYAALLLATALVAAGFDPDNFAGVMWSGIAIAILLGIIGLFIVGITGRGGPALWIASVLLVFVVCFLIFIFSFAYSR
ncbi:MAG TPA: hypothetical protein VD905_21350 [Flavobacteriales bacterium]|nr:hypothetical protein [Flavobacteriales bacterium]